MTDLRDITQLHIQRNDHLASLVIHMEKTNQLSQAARDIIQKIIHSPINSKDGIKLSWDTPLNNQRCLNILRPAVLRQYYGANVDVINESNHFIKRYTYGYGSGTSSVGIDPFNFVTRKMTKEMEYIGTELHEILSKNQKFLNLESADLSQKFNHCTVIMYYTGTNLKQSSSLGMHCDCIYSPKDGSFVRKANSQVENTPAVIYSIGDTRVLNWGKRNIVKSKWSTDLTFSESYDIDSDTITIINQLDENPCSDKNIKEHAQYQHGGVKVTGEQFTTGLVYRVVNCEKVYNIENDAMVVECMPGVNHIVKGVIGFDYVRFHEFLKIQVNNRLLQVK